MLTSRRRDGLYLALLVALAAAPAPTPAASRWSSLFDLAAPGASAQDDWEAEDEEAFVEDEDEADAEADAEVDNDGEAFVEAEAAAEADNDEEAFVEAEAEVETDAETDAEADDSASTEDESDAAAEDEIEFVEDDDDDSWAPELAEGVEENEDDDAIAFDDAYDDGMFFEVEAVEDAGGVVEDEDVRDFGDGFAVGQILQVSASARSASSGGARFSGRGGGSAPRPAADRGGGAEGDDVPYALGGRPVAARSVPWQAQIFNPGAAPDPANPRPLWMRQHNCGGALIADDWVLTAAHCINQQKVDLGFKVRLGAQDLSKGDGQVYRIERIVRHSQYDENSQDLARPPNMYANDIALLRIVPDAAAQRRDPRFIRPIPLNRAPLTDGLPVTVTGWGAVGKGATNEGSALILRVDLRLMDARTCEGRPRRAGKVHAKVFCAANPLQSTCRGDSGGPVVPTNGTPVLAGIVSWGSTTCGGDGAPGMYTRVDQYLGWIEQAMRLPAQRNALP